MNLAYRRVALTRLAGIALAAAWPCPGLTADAAQNGGLDGGSLEVLPQFPSRHISARTVSVWLPPGYDAARTPHAVLYMHDGRNLFDPATAMRGETWGVAAHVATLIQAGKMRPTIVVGIDHGAHRWQEYVPAAPMRDMPAELQQLARGNATVAGSGEAQSDAYLRFLTGELKPFIDSHYRTAPQREHTAVMGSSMGGLVSLYALAAYPQTFGAAGCLSTHWPMTTNASLLYPRPDPSISMFAAAYRQWLSSALPAAGTHRLYFDHGTVNLDALYAPYQQQVDALLANKGYHRGHDWLTEVIEGADHNEAAWRARLALPLQFLLPA